jgi:hypothetical protein
MNLTLLKYVKWFSVIITILAALTISLNFTEVIISYYIFLVGHTVMTFVMYKSKDWSLFSMNIVWITIDIIGIIRWG